MLKSKDASQRSPIINYPMKFEQRRTEDAKMPKDRIAVVTPVATIMSFRHHASDILHVQDIEDHT
jgi:hypothetical protein